MTLVVLDFEEVLVTSGELGRYQVPEGERMLLAHSVPGGVEVLDVPVNGSGDCFWVEDGFFEPKQLHAFVEEYRCHARQLGRCPMSSEALDTIAGLSESGLAHV